MVELFSFFSIFSFLGFSFRPPKTQLFSLTRILIYFSRIYVTLQYQADVVVLAALLTGAMVIGLTIYAYYTKTDYTFCGAFLFAILCIFIATAILAIFLPFGT